MRSALPTPNCITIPPAIAVNMGSFAPQLKKGMTLMVAILSFSSARVRVFIIAGTEQPKPIIIGINALPDKPNLRNILSRINATLAIYPLSSSMEKNRNNNNICGKNDNIANNPPKIPSQTSPVAHSAAPPDAIAFDTASLMEDIAQSNRLKSITPGEFIPPSPKIPSAAVPSKATQPSGKAAPIKRKFSEKVKWNMANSMSKNIGIPQILCVSTLSALSDEVRLDLSVRFFLTNAPE